MELARKMPLEGIVSKRLDAPYRSSRSLDQDQDPRRTGSGAGRLEVHHAGNSVRAWRRLRRRSSGVRRPCRHRFRQDVVRRITPASKAAASDKSPFGGNDAPKKARDVHRLKPELVADNRVRRPQPPGGYICMLVFKGAREDKPAEQDMCSERPAMTGIAKPAAAVREVIGQIRRGDGRRHLET